MEYGFSCMGYEICAALGAKLAKPEQPAYAMVGDGAFMMLHSEMATSLQEGKKITVSFELPGRESVEETRYSGTKYRLRWKGDSVIWHEEIGKEGV